jgi:minor extracellular serine protease Vpr
VQPRDTSTATVTLTQNSFTLGPGAISVLNVSLQGAQPAPGSYEGYIQITSSGPTLRVPYQFLVGSKTPSDLFPVANGGFLGGVGSMNWLIAFRLVDQYGVPVLNTPVQFSVTKGGGSIALGDPQTTNYGLAGADVNLGPTQGDQFFTAAAGGLSYTFQGYARNYPAITNNGVIDAATGRVGQGLAPGSYISIFGTALADATEAYSGTSLPVSLSYGSVTFDAPGLSLPGHLQFVSPGQVNVQIPWEFQGLTSVQMSVASNYLYSDYYTVPLAAYSPGFFPYAGNAAAIDFEAGSIVTSATPAKRGHTVELFVNGLGAVSTTPASGDPASTTALSNTLATPTVTLGGVNLPVSFSGLAPGFVGLYQVNALLPADAPTGSQQLVITIGGISSAPATLPVQ